MIFYSEYTSAQKFCKDDSVVLIQKEYSGKIVWQRSADLQTWSQVPNVSATKDSLRLIVSKPFYYRAIAADNSCPFSSDTIWVDVNPLAPLAVEASVITPTSLDANWRDTTTADLNASDSIRYYLDVSTDSMFNSFVPNFENREIVVPKFDALDELITDFSYTVTGLSYSTKYYYRLRVYADTCKKTSENSNMDSVISADRPDYCTLNSTCTGNITDSRDGNIYKTTQIANQCWMAQNLNTGTYIQGIMPQQNNTTIEKYCYGDNTVNCNTYGGLYSWDEMMAYGTSNSTDGPGPKGICPTGWHLPTNNEWKCLEMNLGVSRVSVDASGYQGTTEGGKLKSTGITLWDAPNVGATNSSGFTAIPGGYRAGATGSFSLEGSLTYFWSATEKDATTSWTRYLTNSNSKIFLQGHSKNSSGLSVRCVKD